MIILVACLLASMVIAYLFWNRGVRMLGPTRTAMYGNLQPLFALTAAWLLLGETPIVWQLVGAAGIIGGVILGSALPREQRAEEGRR